MRILAVFNEGTEVQNILEALEDGAEVLTAHCAFSALEVLRGSEFDVMVVLGELQKVAEVSLVRAVSAGTRGVDLPMVVVSDRHNLQSEAIEAGCTNFLSMSASPGEIKRFLELVVARANSASGIGARDGDLEGDFGTIGLIELIQMFIGARQSGSLLIDVPKGNGYLLFEEGQVVDARATEVNGSSEVGESGLLWFVKHCGKQGAFQFRSELPETVHKTIRKRTDHLLLSLAQVIDESQ